MRGGHRGAAQVLVVVARGGRIDRRARGSNVNSGLAIAGEGGHLAQPGHASNRDDVVALVVGRVARHLVVVLAFVSSRGREKHSCSLGLCDCDGQARVGATATPGVAGNLRAVRDGVVDRKDGVGGAAGASGIQELECHQSNTPPGHASNADAVATDAGNGSRAVSSVHLVVHGIAVLVHEVGAVDVINPAVVVVVDAVSGNFAGVDPHLLAEILVGVVDASVDDGDGDSCADLTVPDPPRLRSIDVVARPVVHAPKVFHGTVGGESLSGRLDLLQGERLPSRFVDTVRGDVAGGFGADVPAEARGQRQGVIFVSAHFPASLLGAHVAVGCQDEMIVRGQILSEVAAQAQSAVVVGHDFPLSVLL
mmetsp:Transcript_77635/g.169999  ORF Transcript_77635/g.169999 Transcript_77635/m.169999 type:complete len:365 (+) Transcript_77635:2482-3576(+)